MVERVPRDRLIQRAVLFLCLALSLCLLMGCPSRKGGSSMPERSGKAKSSGGTTQRGTKPYTIAGKTYHPLVSAHGYSEEGIASWYGKDFHGKQTANGERYDMYSMTAAHKILPFGTQLRVTNVANNRSIIVRVNDRGPFVGNRVIDLTYTGAEQIGMIGPGTAKVRLETIGTVPGLKDGDITGNFYVQVGAFSQKSNADGLAAKMRGQGLNSRVYYADLVKFWRVQAGPYPSLVKAQNAGAGLQSQFPGNFVVAE